MEIQINDALGIGKFSELIGKIIEPSLIRKRADAICDAIPKIEGATTKNPNTEVTYTNGQFSITERSPADLLERAEKTQQLRAMQKQENIESVLSYTYNELRNDTTECNGTVNPDWFANFLDYVENVSVEDMRIIWGKILAGEIKRPSSFSLRTLDILHKLSTREARYFVKCARYIFGDEEMAFLISDSKDILDKYVPYGVIIGMNEAGLISSQQASFSPKNTPGCVVLPYQKKYILHGHRTTNNNTWVFRTNIYPVTEAGLELLSIINREEDKEYLDELVNALNEEYKDKTEFSISSSLEKSNHESDK